MNGKRDIFLTIFTGYLSTDKGVPNPAPKDLKRWRMYFTDMYSAI